MCAIFLPFVVYWGQDVLSRPARRWLVLGMGALIFGLGGYQGAMVFPLVEISRPQLASPATFLGLALLSFMLVPLVSGWARSTVYPSWAPGTTHDCLSMPGVMPLSPCKRAC